ncbi:hypothetical protein BC940DRAFT_54167 [Gongronella butleri]|nr:hypothetical protein BC940DRAFT_54167 [Gongronella butleri]
MHPSCSKVALIYLFPYNLDNKQKKASHRAQAYKIRSKPCNARWMSAWPCRIHLSPRRCLIHLLLVIFFLFLLLPHLLFNLSDRLLLRLHHCLFQPDLFLLLSSRRLFRPHLCLFRRAFACFDAPLPVLIAHSVESHQESFRKKKFKKRRFL